MTIKHHIPEEIIAAFSAGTLDHGQHIAAATHISACAACRKLARSFESVGGAVLEEIQPTAMAVDALAKIKARLDEPQAAPLASIVQTPEGEIPGLPKFLRGYRFGDWKWIAPSTYVRPVELPHPSDTRVFLLKARPGTKLLPHSHTGTEMTCILAGGYSQHGDHYRVGDFDFGDDTVHHRPVVDAGEDCVCLVAMQGGFRLNGLLGKLIQPFIRI